MSNVLFPTLPGLSFGAAKAPGFTTKAQRSVSGMEARAAMAAYPLWKFKLSYEFLRHGASTELRQMLGFFLARQGSFDSFLFADPEDNSVTDQNIGTGTGAQKQFQLIRSFGYGAGCTFDEPVHNVNAVSAIKVNGVTKTAGTDYTVSATGLVTLTTAPANALPITWTGSYYYRCRFAQDETEFNKFMYNLFELRSIEFVGSTMNKV